MHRRRSTGSGVDTKFVLHENRVMKNVTITMEDHVAEWARVEAARRNTSVSRLVGELVAEKMRHDDAYERAMQEAVRVQGWGASTAPSLSDAGLYDRSQPRT